MPTPEFKVGHKIVTLVIGFKNSITPHKTGDDPVKGVLKDILDIIKNNPGIQKPAIAARIGKSEATAKRNLKQLVERNLIEYKGSDKTECYNPKEKKFCTTPKITEPVSIPHELPAGRFL